MFRLCPPDLYLLTEVAETVTPMRVAVLIALVAVPAAAQDRAATERRLSNIQEQIAATQRQVERTRGQEASAVQALDGLSAEVALREELVSGYRTQVGTIRGETQTLRRSIERLDTEVEAARQSYRARARHAYMHGRRNGLALILASGSVTQMIVRARYLQQFAARRRAQVQRIAQKTSEMRGREQEVRKSLEETQRLLQQTQAEQTRLAQSRRERESLIVDLRSQTGRLERELDQRRRDAQQLAGVVADLVAEERRRAAEEQRRREAATAAEAARQAEIARAEAAQRAADEAARRARELAEIRRQPERRTPDPAPAASPQPEAPAVETPATPPASATPAEPPRPEVAEARPPEPRTAPTPRSEARAAPPAERPAPRTAPAPVADAPVDLTGSFRSNRGRLPWPVTGTVTGRFGTRRDPVTNTTTSAVGIDIAVSPGAPTRAVFEGVVQRVGSIPTYGTYVMVTHGEFVTLYGNLSQVSVRQGQRVRAGTAIGRAGTTAERRGAQLFFALYQDGTASDPLRWLRPR